ncbi:MAG: Kua-ubiquitin conjugating enzyme hybrid localization domain protein [Verrucomicrobiales bacterium]|nr:Kua-ubiquitin conjugating enzyme hybrid localization domain protein [Verrucomicrobiales bacterium]
MFINSRCAGKERYNADMKMFVLPLLEVIGVILAADFVAGFIHWFEDAYVRENTPLIGKWVARNNIIHHHYPRYFTKKNWWQSSWDLLGLSSVLILAAWALGVLSWHVWLFAFVVTNGNQVHKWAHQTRKENGRFISFLQDIRILQTAHHHALHHTDPKNSHYCVVTNILNPVLNGVGFWNGLEWVIAKTTGFQRRDDTSNEGFGPGPEWLSEFRRPSAPKRPANLVAVELVAVLSETR